MDSDRASLVLDQDAGMPGKAARQLFDRLAQGRMGLRPAREQLAADPLLDPMQPGGVEAERRQEPVERRDRAPRHDGERAAEAVA